MAFDTTKDKELWKQEVSFEKGKIIVAVMQYNDGDKKLQISRMVEDKWAKLGRMTKEEVQAVLPLITEAQQEM